MTFVNALLAFGAFAFTIPLAIHLLHRSRFTTIDWGAWHLLDSVIRINRRRMQITNLLLLLLRCAIPILLAFCLARPVLTGFHALPGDASRTLVIVIDDSRSMAAAAEGQLSRMDMLKQGLSDLLRDMTRRDEIMLIQASAVDSPPATMGAADALERIRGLRAEGGPVELARLVDAAVAAAEQSSHAQRSIVIASDFQSCNVGQATSRSLEGLSARMKEVDPVATVNFWNIGDAEASMPNISVDSVAVDSPAVVAGRSSQLSARIRNASDIPLRDLRVIWSIDGVALPSRLVDVEANASATSRLSHRIDEPGVHEVTVSVEHADSLAADNRRSVAVDVMREIQVLIVDGKPSRQPLEGQADFLAIALSPFAFGGDDQPDSVKTTVKQSNQIVKTLEESAPEIIILANVRTLKEDERKAIASFVLQGGSLIVFDGNDLKSDDYNLTWTCDQGSLELPAVLGDVVGDPKAERKAKWRIGEINPQYAPWNLLTASDQQPLSEVEIYAYRQLELPPSGQDDATNQAVDDRTAAGDPNNVDSVASSATPTATTSDSLRGVGNDDPSPSVVLLKVSDGNPLVVASKRGRGHVYQFAIPCNASWTTLPLRMVFLPMMQQMVLDLAGCRKATTLSVGQPIAIPIEEFSALAESSMDASVSASKNASKDS
ncbi:MAG: VWA domain-containing protein, partial [Pirellulaceae bacterium]|nr:VWA domain-containing protein [Pirellulaceae bacterium]